MPTNELRFSSDFKDTVAYCKENELFLGSGNPNADILLIGNFPPRTDITLNFL